MQYLCQVIGEFEVVMASIGLGNKFSRVRYLKEEAEVLNNYCASVFTGNLSSTPLKQIDCKTRGAKSLPL